MSTAIFTDDVKAYWEDPRTVSIIDKNLHRLEIDTVIKYLRPTDSLVDLGCGDGEATVEYARHVARCIGVERSQYLRRKAQAAADKSGRPNIVIQPGDVLGFLPRGLDVVLTQRLLINLAGWDEQQEAIKNIHGMLKPGGRYLMVENTDDGFQNLNDVRVGLGLEPIPQHWHNKFFNRESLLDFMLAKGRFYLVKHHDFSLYYLLTRAYAQLFAKFEGCGAEAVKDPIFEKADAAARLVFEKLGGELKLDKVYGPIQVFVWEKA